MTQVKFVGLLLAGLALVACSDDDGSNPGGGSGLDDKQVQDLTPTETQTVCNEINTESTLSKEDMCDLAGLLAAALGGDCEEGRAACISNPEEPEQDSACESPETEGCTATVGEIKACAAAMTAMLRGLSCASTNTEAPETPEACSAVQQKCPQFLETSQPDGSGGVGGGDGSGGSP